MHRPTLVFSLVLLLLAAAIVPEALGKPSELERKVDAYIEPLLRTNNFAGVVWVDRRGQTVFAKGYGLAAIEQRVAHTPDTRFQVASLSKPFTAAAVLILAERGKIDLQAPLSRILPGYPQGDRLTVHHLLAHRSGIPNINDLPEYEALQLSAQTPESLVAAFSSLPLGFAPGEKYEYSNSNYNLLALIIEKVSGHPYGAFVDTEILRPLGLAATGHRGGMTAIVPDLANGYAPRGSLALERASYLDWTAKTGNGSLYSTAGDLIRFARAIHGPKLLSEKSRTMTFQAHSPNVGYGWFLTQANGKPLHHINGRSPGWAAQLDHYIDEDLTVVVLSNVYSSVTTSIARGVGAHAMGTPVQPMPALRSGPLKPEELQPLLGTYRFGADYYIPNSTVTIVEQGGQIQAEYSSGYPPSAYIAITPTKFIVRPFWMPAEFVIGPDGRASELVLDGFRGRRE